MCVCVCVRGVCVCVCVTSIASGIVCDLTEKCLNVSISVCVCKLSV